MHSPGRLSSSKYDISYVHNSKIKLVQLNICTTKTKLDHYYSSRVDYRFVESFLENPHLTWCIHSTVGDGRSFICPRVHYTKMSSTREWRRSDPRDNSRDSSSSHIWWRLNRLKVNPKYRLIIFLKKDLAGLTSRSEGAVTGTTSGTMEGPGAPRFLWKQKPYKLSTNHMHTPCIVLSNFSIQSRSSFPIWAFNKQNQITK